MAGEIWEIFTAFLIISAFGCHVANGDVPAGTMKKIDLINQKGTHLGVIVPNVFELAPILQSPDYKADTGLPFIDFAGRRFRFGSIGHKRVIIVMTGLSMINAATTTQLLLGLFKVEGVVNYGVAGNANPSLIVGDVTIPRYWAHSALWSWQRFGDSPQDELPLENTGAYTRTFGSLRFANYTTDGKKIIRDKDNLLNSVWYQPEEIFPVDGTPEERQHVFWVPVNARYLKIAKKLEGLKLKGCVNSTLCLPRTPKVVTVSRGMSASIFIDNAAYRDFLFSKFRLTPIDMESASVALVCHQQRVPFIVIRGLSDLAGGGSAESNEADIFVSLAAENTITALVELVKLL
ncbi:phosphorylase superfamily protein [Wolffia australiana]